MKYFFTMLLIWAFYPAQATLRVAPSSECVTIILNNGREISARVIELNAQELRYKRCEDSIGPEYIINTSDVRIVKNTKNEVIYMPQKDSDASSEISSGKKVLEPNAVIALLMVFVFFPLAFVFGYISLDNIRKNPKKYEGKMLAQVALTLAWIYLAIILIALAVFFSIFGGL